jgi:hypothetical protein
VSALPVIVGMGVVEWRARRFGVDARDLLRRVTEPRAFVRRVWLLVLGGLGICVISVAALAAVLLTALAATDRLSTAGVVAAGAGVLLAGAYFLGFLLANLSRFGSLCAALAVCLSFYLVAETTVVGPLVDATALAAATVLLNLLYFVALARCVGDARRHR